MNELFPEVPSKRIIRVFPSYTHATPTDDLVRIDKEPCLFDEADEVHISVTFTWDIPRAEYLAQAWECVAPVRVGGAAFNERGGEFVAGRYLKHGYVITSRGCPNRCWFCSVPRREGYELRELPVVDGWDVLDDNLLACSPQHIEKVFAMLRRQPKKPIFSGGLEARLLTPEMAARLHELRPQRMFFAYDTPDDYAYLVEAGKMLRNAGVTLASEVARCYVLIGYWGDTIGEAEQRLIQTCKAGFFPFAMLFRHGIETCTSEWKRFQNQWLNH